ncbi:putative chloride channel-like protein CLC-g [Magnolia sinica]|uniref:putative chloride channel-like protein CLC-g n=1 Tax=Magnolia sinica TaxID=86752 RepID=UPI0026598F4D|nr:putative chloride channel-like protein CLC-g [Magnolia sinica]XP_058112054.1 putative chloride channel-like protein CLC-g [Magnolia sinica]
MVEEESRPLLSEPILDHHHHHLHHHQQQQQYQQHQQNLLTLRRSTSNTTSQVALVGADVCPIESLDYEILENEFFKQDWRTRNRSQIFQYILMKWTLCFLLGIFAGLVGFFNNISIENVAGIKFVVTSNMMLANKYGQAFAVFAVSNFILTLFSTVITAYIAPAAAGSGIPEVKAYLNGVDAPEIFAPRTLIVKILGSICAVSASLHVGKAGPLVHIGACIAALLGQGGSKKYGLTCRWLRYFKNDRDRRDLVTCGSAAGIATAFRAPVGGVLFALEEVSSWWRSALLWRAFFTTAIVAVVLRALIDTCNSDKCGLFGKGGLIMFDVTAANISYHLTDLPPVIVLGIIGGILGSIYNFLLERVIRIYNFINEKGTAYKLLLACSVSIFTSCCLFGLPWLAPCRPCPAESPEACPTIGRSGNFKKFQCLPGHYNDLASLFFNTNDDAIRNLYSSGTNNEFQYLSILLFFISSFFLGILSYGIVVPSGLFVPVILTGATYGRFVGMLMGSHSNLDHGLFAVLGSASFLGGSMRNTVSLCIILLELTNNLLLLPLVMLVLLISKTVADIFNGNIYDVLVKLKGFPYLETHAEPYMRQLMVSDVITGPLQFFNGIEKVGNIVHVLKATRHHGFPVIDEPPFSDSPVLFGLVLRAHLLVLLKKKDFLHARMLASIDASRQFSAEDFAKRGSGRHDQIEDIELTAEEMEMFIDLHPFTNTSPYTVVETMSLAKALILFREVGLRHLLVVPKSSGRAPVVGILTRHDFMPQHILGLHPFLQRSRWKRLRFRHINLLKLFRKSQQSLVGPNP